jgi:hypothetical protein
MREEARSCGGCCAIKSGGRRKSKSETSTKMIIGLERIDQMLHRKCSEALDATVLCGKRVFSRRIESV